MERVISTVEARANLSQILAEAGYAGRSTVIERNRRPLAVVIGYDEYRELIALRQQEREREARSAVYCYCQMKGVPFDNRCFDCQNPAEWP